MHNSLTALLTQVRDGSISVADAALQLREAPFEDLGYARVDHHRRLRQGAAEVIYGAGKTPEQIAGIVDSAAAQRAADHPHHPHEAGRPQPICRSAQHSTYDAASRIGIVGSPCPEPDGDWANRGRNRRHERHARRRGGCAHSRGARATASRGCTTWAWPGCTGCSASLDVAAWAPACVIAVAGMEGALASVVGGLVDCPVIAVPTSVGYGRQLRRCCRAAVHAQLLRQRRAAW